MKPQKHEARTNFLENHFMITLKHFIKNFLASIEKAEKAE